MLQEFKKKQIVGEAIGKSKIKFPIIKPSPLKPMPMPKMPTPKMPMPAPKMPMPNQDQMKKKYTDDIVNRAKQQVLKKPAVMPAKL